MSQPQSYLPQPVWSLLQSSAPTCSPVLALTCASVGIYAALVIYWTLPPCFLGGAAAASGIAFINSVGNLGGFLGPALMGWLKQTTGGYAAGMLVLAGFLIVPAAVVVLLGRTRALAPAPAPR